MFYNGDLKNGANVRKTDFRPLYLTGANTRIESKIETFSDGSDGSDGEWREREDREDGEEREEGEDEEEEEDGEEREEDKVDSSALLVEAKSSSSASSFLSSLSSMYTAGSKSKNINKESVKPVKSNRNKIIKSSNGRDTSKERNSSSSSAEISEDEITLKPLIFFDLLTSEDSSGTGTGTGTGTGSGIGSGTDNSHSHSNIGDSDHSYCTSMALIASLLSHCNSSLSLSLHQYYPLSISYIALLSLPFPKTFIQILL